MDPFLQVDQRYPGFLQFCQDLWGCFLDPRQVELVRNRLGPELEVHQAQLEACLKKWTERGILPSVRVAGDEEVALLWSSPLYYFLLDRGLGFSPHNGDDIRPHLPPRRRDKFAYWVDLVHRFAPSNTERMARGEVGYWQLILGLQACELYVEALLPQGRGKGCDLACGWGRATLPLLFNCPQLECWGLDLADHSLDLLSQFARSLGVQDRLRVQAGELTHLPFEDASLDFFLAFDVFEHMTQPLAARILQEVLRCSKAGTVLHLEIPLNHRSDALTHICPYSASEVEEFFSSQIHPNGLRFRLRMHETPVPMQFSFVATQEGP